MSKKEILKKKKKKDKGQAVEAHVKPSMTMQKNNGGARQKENQLAHLSHAVFLEESGNPRLIRRATQVTMATLFLFLGWAALTPVDELSRGLGEVVPSSSVQNVQHYEGGIVESIHVEDGQFVDKGTVLVSLNPVGAEADLQAMRVEGVALMLERARLQAFTEGRDVDFSAFQKDYPELVDDHKKILTSSLLDRAQQVMTFDKKVEQEQEKLLGLKKKLGSEREKRTIAKEELDINEKLYKKGHNSRVSYLNAKKEYARAKENVNMTGSEIRVTGQGIEQAQSERAQIDTKLRQDAFKSLADVELKHSSLIEKMRKLEDRSLRLAVVSPARGIVKGLNTTTIGAVVPPGGYIADIVPVDQSLIVETKLSTRDIGHINIGQKVNVKIDSYDFSRYGGINGTLLKISATTFLDEKTSEPYYKGVVELAQNYVGQRADRNPILPGMTVQADVITGEKSVMAYLLKPVALAVDTAFSER